MQLIDSVLVVKVIMALMNLRGHGITEERILELNSFLGDNGYNDMNGIVKWKLIEVQSKHMLP
jgi:hypothetical protein